MQQKDIDTICRLIEKYKPKLVLEWGCGRSTIYFPTKYKSIDRWISIEHDSEWINAIKEKSPSNVDLYLHSDNYVENETTNKAIKNADFIIVDGIKRETCIKFANIYCKKNALIILHDADRPGYQNFFNIFNYNERLTKGRVPDSKGGFKRDGVSIFSKKKIKIKEK